MIKLFITVCISCGLLVAPIVWAQAPVFDAETMQLEDTQDFPTAANDQPDNRYVQQGYNQDVPPAQTPEDRIRRVERLVNNLQNNDFSARVDSLQSQVQSLRGEVEQLTHQLQQLQNQLQSQVSDLDRRLTQTKVAPTQTVAANNTATNAKETNKPAADDQPNVAEEQNIYQTAYNQIKAKKYEDAVATLQGMLRKYPSGQFAANAHYWLGELYSLMGKTREAATEFDNVVSKYPDSPRVPDAQFKMGLIFASQSRWKDARAAFRAVINQFPGTAASRLASEQMTQLRQAGH